MMGITGAWRLLRAFVIHKIVRNDEKLDTHADGEQR